MKMKGERMAKRTSFGSIVRKRLSDITNSQSQPKLGATNSLKEREKQPEISLFAEDLINQLLKEKATLTKLVEERNKIIELSGNELRNLRMNYQKLQLQNWNLAQSNSQILAELNLGREKLKALQHELLCKDALLKSKNMEPEGGKKVPGECSQKNNNDIKSSIRSKRVSARTMGPPTTHRQAIDKEKIANKRHCVRRQSARFKSQEREPTENLFEIEDAKFPAAHPFENSMQDGEALDGVSHRLSTGRPLRKAVEKVQSYKEVPLNVKMRRAE